MKTFGASVFALEIARKIVHQRGLRVVSVSNKDLSINVVVYD